MARTNHSSPVDHTLHGHGLVVRHVAEDAEGDHPGQEAGPRVHEAGDHRVLGKHHQY